jgi:hypothetical protein
VATGVCDRAGLAGGESAGQHVSARKYAARTQVGALATRDCVGT